VSKAKAPQQQRKQLPRHRRGAPKDRKAARNRPRPGRRHQVGGSAALCS